MDGARRGGHHRRCPDRDRAGCRPRLGAPDRDCRAGARYDRDAGRAYHAGAVGVGRSRPGVGRGPVVAVQQQREWVEQLARHRAEHRRGIARAMERGRGARSEPARARAGRCDARHRRRHRRVAVASDRHEPRAHPPGAERHRGARAGARHGRLGGRGRGASGASPAGAPTADRRRGAHARPARGRESVRRESAAVEWRQRRRVWRAAAVVRVGGAGEGAGPRAAATRRQSQSAGAASQAARTATQASRRAGYGTGEPAASGAAAAAGCDDARAQGRVGQTR